MRDAATKKKVLCFNCYNMFDDDDDDDDHDDNNTAAELFCKPKQICAFHANFAAATQHGGSIDSWQLSNLTHKFFSMYLFIL